MRSFGCLWVARTARGQRCRRRCAARERAHRHVDRQLCSLAAVLPPAAISGRLAVCGTVNGVATSGANVRYLSCGFILEEGLPHGQAASNHCRPWPKRRARRTWRSSRATPRWSSAAGPAASTSIPPAWARCPRAWRSAAPTASLAMSSWCRVHSATTVSPS